MKTTFKSILLGLGTLAGLGAMCATPTQTTNQNIVPTPTAEHWVMSNLAAIPGEYADQDVVTLDNGTYRMYYATEPESVEAVTKPIYSAMSADGVHWAIEDGARLTNAAFPDVLKLSDGSWRMYFQGNDGSGLKSAISTDGLNWTVEDGVRIPTLGESIPGIELLGAPTTTQLADGSYAMVYRGTLNQSYGTDVPNSTTQVFLWATSADGLTWEKQGLAIDSRNTELNGLVDGPDWVKWSDGSVRLYFWGYKGVYYSTFSGNSFSTPILTLDTPNPQGLMFPPNPPGDPSLVQVGDTWFMYYGFHTKGIYYATLTF